MSCDLPITSSCYANRGADHERGTLGKGMKHGNQEEYGRLIHEGMVRVRKNKVKYLTSRTGGLGAAHSPRFRWLKRGIGFTRARHWNNQ